MAFEAKIEQKKYTCDFCKTLTDKNSEDAILLKVIDRKEKISLKDGREVNKNIWINLHRDCYSKLKEFLDKER